jgi:hypothetical protein
MRKKEVSIIVSAVLIIALFFAFQVSSQERQSNLIVELLFPANDTIFTGDQVSFGANIRIDDGSEPSNILVPGEGWTSLTGEPNPVGNPNDPGYDAKAIARWDVVPYQNFDGIFEIGVVAFHMNGIDRVEFSVDDGPWLAVREMTFNPRTGVVEYWVKLDASLFSSDGPIEVRAIAWPKDAGMPRVLGGDYHDDPLRGAYSLSLYAQPSGAIPNVIYVDSSSGNDSTATVNDPALPAASIMKAGRLLHDYQGGDAGGSIIYLNSGEHEFAGEYSAGLRAKTLNNWLTIQPAPGVERQDVVLVTGSSAGLRTHLVRFHNVTIAGTMTSASGGTLSGLPPTAWVDQSVMHLNDSTDSRTFFGSTSWLGGVFATESEASNALRPFNSAFNLVRNVKIQNVSGDSIQNVPFTVNVEIRDLVRVGNIHADVWQWHTGGRNIDNVIVFGLNATENVRAQSLFVRGMQDQSHEVENWAIVNYLVRDWGGGNAQWGHKANHILIWNSGIVGGNSFMVRSSDTTANGTYIIELRNFQIRNSVFNGFSYGATNLYDVTVNNNHFASSNNPYGTNYTLSPDFEGVLVNISAGDFRPAQGSPLLGRVNEVIVPFDIRGNPVNIGGSIGALQP